MRVSLLVLLAACGRVGFDAHIAPDEDAMPDAGNFVPATGLIDTTFGAGGIADVVLGGGSPLFDIERRTDGGYFAVGVSGQLAGTGIKKALVQILDASGNLGPAQLFATEADSYGFASAKLGNRLIVAGMGDTHVDTDLELLSFRDTEGTLDPGFGTGGVRDIDFSNLDQMANDVAIVGDKVVTCGTYGSNAANPELALTRLDLATGAFDPSFGSAGLQHDDITSGSVDDECHAIAADARGHLFVTGTTFGSMYIASYLPDGARDVTGFATYRADVSGIGIAIAPDGDVVAIGTDATGPVIVRLAPDGTPRAAFGTAGVVRASAIASRFGGIQIQPDGKIVVAGSQGTAAIVARYTGAGVLDATFGTGGVFQLVRPGQPLALGRLLLDGGKIIAVGIANATEPYDGIALRLQ